MRKTLVQTLLAAFCAIPFAVPLEGGGVMLLGARNFFASDAGGIPLPPGARRVEYLNQPPVSQPWKWCAIDTGLYFQSGDHISLTFMSDGYNHNNNGCFWGYFGANAYGDNADAIRICDGWYSAGLVNCYALGRSRNLKPDPVAQKIRAEIGESDKAIRIFLADGSEVVPTSYATMPSGLSGGTLSLFRGKKSDGTYTGAGQTRIYSYAHYDSSGNPRLVLSPIAIGTVGYMFDELTGTTYANLNTDSRAAFVIGPDV